jgi:hypothetical protein
VKNGSMLKRFCRRELFLPLVLLTMLEPNSQAQTPLAPKAEVPVEQVQHYSHKQLRSLMSRATNSDDYRRLATYFHYQEMFFRAKAQKTLDDYFNTETKYKMATKFVTRAEVASRSYNDSLSKAENNARLADRYDEMLTETAIKPEKRSATLVSVENLKRASRDTGTSALLKK